MFASEKIQQLNDLEILVYNYIMKNKKQVTYMTVRDLAQAVHVSTSTIVRFCKKMGCDGYAEFRVKFKIYLQESENKKSETKEDLEELLHYFHGIDSEQFEDNIKKVANMIQIAHNVIFIGIGTSGILGKYGARLFSNHGKYSQHIEDPYYPVLEDMYENTVVIAMSVSGETKEMLELVRSFQEHNCMILAITNKGSSTLAKMAGSSLTYYVSNKTIGEKYNVTTQVPAIFLIEAIASRL